MRRNTPQRLRTQRNILDSPRRLQDRDIARLLGVHKSTVCRWRVRGMPSTEGRLCLPYTRCGKKAYVHPDDLADFLGRLTAAEQCSENPAPPFQGSECPDTEADRLGL